MKTIPIKIPVKKHIYKFLTSNFGQGYTLSSWDFLGTILTLMLKNQSVKYDSRFNNKNYPSKYTILVPINLYEQQGMDSYLSTQSVVYFNNIIEGVHRFTTMMGVHCMTNYHPKTKKDAIEIMHSLFDIDEMDLADETTRKAFLRLENKGGLPKLKMHKIHTRLN